jgi:microcystin-dependent protein
MSEPFIGQITLFAGNFAPRGWAFCDGQILFIAQNTALFSLLGTTYGGDGRTNFALPDLRGRAPVHMGQGPGLSLYVLGQVGGTENQTLTVNQIPAHAHTTQVFSNTDPATSTTPTNTFLANSGEVPIYANSSNQTLAGPTTGSSGANQPFNNVQPYLALNYIIALQGIFPSRP